MKKISLAISAALLLLCSIFTLQSQTLVTVGTTTTYNSSTQFPTVYSRQYGSTHQQILVLAQELLNAGAPAGGNITSIAFNVYAVNNSGPLPNYTIKMKHTSASSISTFDNSGLTQVYTSSNYNPTTGWNTHTFSTQFQWNGSSNILIDICNGLTSPQASNYNASVYANSTGYSSNVIGVDNSTNQCGGSTVTTSEYGKSTMKFSITANLPSCANLTSPANGATSLPINTTLAWTNGGNTTSYDVYFGTNSTPPFIVNQTGLTYNPGVLHGNTTYYWKIVAKNASGYATGCVTRSFTTGSDCPANLLPADGSTNILTYQTLSWNTVPLTTKYYLYLGTSPNPPLYDSTSGTTYSVVDLKGNTTYYWKVAPRNALGLVTGCGVSSFTTRTTNHWFIKANGNDGAAGDCWNNAKQDLSAVMINAAVGDSIYVAAGTYLPTRDKSNNPLPADFRDYCFTLNQGIKLMGGYPSTATGANLQTSLLVPRDPIANLTTLSGNIGTNDSLDNCYHVVWAASGNGGPSLIDGFKIFLGYANGASAQIRHQGAGIYASGGKVTIINSVIERNYTYTTSGNAGGGIYSNSCILLFENSTLNYNCSGSGSAIYAYSGKLTLKGSAITDNYNSIAVYTASSNVLTIDNCTMWNNYAYTDMYLTATGTAPQITNSTLQGININSGTPPTLNNTICAYPSSQITNLKYCITSGANTTNYFDGSGVQTSGLPQMSFWLLALSNNGGTTKTCPFRPYFNRNPAIGTGNPVYAGTFDQRGIVRANPPCIGSVEVPYALASDIQINDTAIYKGSTVTLTAKSLTVSSPIFEWYSDAALTNHVGTGSTYTSPVLNSNYYFYITVYNSTIFHNPKAYAKKVTVYVTQMPIITQQPVNTIKCVGESAMLTVSSYGTGLSYQWVKNNVNMPGQTNDTLIFTNIQYADSGYYFCKVTNANGTTSCDTVKLTVHSIPVALSSVTGINNICAGLTGIPYSISMPDVITYNWTLPTGATGTSNSDSIIVDYSLSAQPGNITVIGTNQCGSSSPSSLFITIGNFAPVTPGNISGASFVCRGQTNLTYSISPVPNATSYIWTLPGGATGISTTNSINVNYGGTAVSGNITVKGQNSCGIGSASVLPVIVGNLLSGAGSINGYASVCQGQNNVIYSVSSIPNATSYIWTLPTGATGSSSTDSIIVNFSVSAQSGNITVQGQNSCGLSPSASLSVNLNNLPATAGTISGSANVIPNQNNVLYYIFPVAGATSYTWTLPSGATGTSSADSIIVNYGALAQSGNITVTPHNSCGDGISSSLAITVGSLSTPTTQATNVTVTNITSNTASVSWTRGNGSSCAVFICPTSLGTPSPVNNTNYTANAVYRQGDEIGSSGWYCIYNGTGTSVNVSGLGADTTFSVMVCEYNTYGLNSKYLTNSSTGNPVNFTTIIFVQQTGISLMAMYSSNIEWGDYDNDGLLDIVVCGDGGSTYYFTKIYKNNGNNTFTDQTGISITGVKNGNTSWGDYNNDGWLDILICGQNSSGLNITKLFKNNGNNTFTEQTGISLPGLMLSAAMWVDYNNDGWLDILVRGMPNASTAYSKIFKNNGNNTFTEQIVIYMSGSTAWGDYNNDGWKDLIIAGVNASSYACKLYKNNGNNTFAEQTSIGFPDFRGGRVSWGDYNNDGWLDILINGDVGNTPYTKIYKNNGNNTFTEQTSISLTGLTGVSGWLDYNNDGLLDIILSGSDYNGNHFLKIYKNNGNNTFTEKTNINITGSYDEVVWGDYDNDGSLDLLIASGNFPVYTKVYKNLGNFTNSGPLAPSNLQATQNGTDLTLKWNRTTDDHTPKKGITYNICIGTTPGGINKFSPMADVSTGFRRIVGLGSSDEDTSWTIKNVSAGTYYWSVQGIDHSYKGGPFAPVQVVGQLTAIISPNGPTTFCQGDSVILNANSGTGYSYQWQNNGTDITGATSSLLVVKQSGVYTVKITDGGGSTVLSAQLTVTVNPSLQVNVSIAANPSGGICAGNNVVFTATPINGGTAPGYQWKKNGTTINGATNSTYSNNSLSNGDIITCVMSSNVSSCIIGSPATSNAITMTVGSALPASVSITANPSGAVCAGTNVTFTANPVNGGFPTYQWLKNGTNISGATNSTYSSVSLANGDAITCTMTSSLSCATGSPTTSNAITMTLSSSLPASVTIAANTSGAICAGTSVIFTATPVNGGTPTYQWKKNGANISGATNSAYSSSTLANNDTINCVMTSSLSCATGSPATSNTITMVVNPVITAGVSIAAVPSGAVCAGTNVTFTATPVNGGAAPTYQWKKNSANINGATNVTWSSSALVSGDAITCVMTSNATTCLTGSPATSNQIVMTVNAIPATPVITSVSNYLHSSAATGNQWYLNNSAINGATSQNYTPLVNGTYYVIVTLNNCSSDTSNIITVTNVGIAEITAGSGIAIYPNPANSVLSIELAPVGAQNLVPAQTSRCKVYDILGTLIIDKTFTGNKTQIDVRSLSKGLYFLRVESEEGSAVRRFVKE